MANLTDGGLLLFICTLSQWLFLISTHWRRSHWNVMHEQLSKFDFFAGIGSVNMVGFISDTFFLYMHDFQFVCWLGGVYMTPERVHSGSLSWLYICLHDTTTKCHAATSHPGVSSPRFSHQGENFTPVRNLATVSCKRETTTHIGVKSVCR